jgi:hypothetical protein
MDVQTKETWTVNRHRRQLWARARTRLAEMELQGCSLVASLNALALWAQRQEQPSSVTKNPEGNISTGISISDSGEKSISSVTEPSRIFPASGRSKSPSAKGSTPGRSAPSPLELAAMRARGAK